jgi:hypothetical protein
MLISRYQSNDTINVYLNNRRLDQVTEMKYLGIYFDCRLTFDKHIENIVEKSMTMTYMLSKSAKLHWGLGHKSLKIIINYYLSRFKHMEPQFGKRLLGNTETSASCKEYRG